jgi:hypothetical protein
LVVIFSSLTIVVALTLNLPSTAKAAEQSKTEANIEGPGPGTDSGYRSLRC